MADPAYVYLIPIAELSPGAVSAIRNEVKEELVSVAAKELSIPRADLVTRDIRSFTDLKICQTSSVIGTEYDWLYTTGGSGIHAWEYWSDEDQTMADNAFIMLYGLRDLSMRNQAWAEATPVAQAISLVKVEVGNSTKTIWDAGCLGAYSLSGPAEAICPTGILIPQNVSFQLSVYCNANSKAMYLQAVGIVCEPRGTLISP